jgi:hypothetical protein
MSTVADDIAEAFLEARDAFGVPITIADQDVTAMVTESQFARDLVEGGFQLNAQVEVRVLLADLNVPPVLGAACLYEGAPFRISNIVPPRGGLVGEFTLSPRGR